MLWSWGRKESAEAAEERRRRKETDEEELAQYWATVHASRGASPAPKAAAPDHTPESSEQSEVDRALHAARTRVESARNALERQESYIKNDLKSTSGWRRVWQLPGEHPGRVTGKELRLGALERALRAAQAEEAELQRLADSGETMLPAPAIAKYISRTPEAWRPWHQHIPAGGLAMSSRRPTQGVEGRRRLAVQDGPARDLDLPEAGAGPWTLLEMYSYLQSENLKLRSQVGLLEAEVVALKAQRLAFKEQPLGARAGGAAVATRIDEPSSQAGSPAPATSVAQAFAGVVAGVGPFCRAPPPKQRRPRRKNRHVGEGGGEGGGAGGGEGGGEGGAMEHRKRPVVVCGPSGVGKGTLISRLLNDHPDLFGFSVSHTTRAPRPGEQHGVHYYFVEPAEMEAMIARGEFVEYARVHSHVYGTSLAGVRAVSAAGKTCVLEIDVMGATLLKKTSLDALFIFIAPPSMSELEKRLRGRSTETDEQISLRLGAAQREMASLEISGFYDAVIINDDLEGAYARLREIVVGAATARAHTAAPPSASPAPCWAPKPCWAPAPCGSPAPPAATPAAPSQGLLQRKHKHRHRKTPERVAADDEERFMARMDLREAGEATLTKPPAPTPAPGLASAGSAGNDAALAAATGPAPQPKVAHTPELPPPPSPPPMAPAAGVARVKLYSSASTNWGPQMKVSAGEVEAINARIRSKSMAKGLSPAAHQNILRGAAVTAVEA